VAVDAAELFAGLGHAGGAPAQRHLPFCQCLTLREWVRAIEIIDSMLLVLRRVRAVSAVRPGAARLASRSCLRAVMRRRRDGCDRVRGRVPRAGLGRPTLARSQQGRRRDGIPAPLMSCGSGTPRVPVILVRASRVPVPTGTHGELPALADRSSLTVHGNTPPLTPRGSPLFCKAGPRTARRATRVPLVAVSSGHQGSLLTTAGRRSRPRRGYRYRRPKLPTGYRCLRRTSLRDGSTTAPDSGGHQGSGHPITSAPEG
jgi:hypothetical protein